MTLCVGATVSAHLEKCVIANQWLAKRENAR